MKLSKLKTLAKVIAGTLIVSVCGLAGLRWIIQYRFSKSLPPNLLQIEFAPLAALSGDHVYDELLNRLKAFETTNKEFPENCRLDVDIKKHWNECNTFLSKYESKIEDFEKWADSQAEFTLERPKDLGLHRRKTIDKYSFETEPPNFIPFIALSKLLALKAVKLFSVGNVKGAKNSLKHVFELGGFLQQNPTTLELMIAEAIYRTGMTTIAFQLSPKETQQLSPDMLPKGELLRRDHKVALATEFLTQKNFFGVGLIKESLPSPKKPVAYVFNLLTLLTFDREEIMKKLLSNFQWLQSKLDGNQLSEKSFNGGVMPIFQELNKKRQDPWYSIGWKSQVGMMVAAWPKYIARTAQTIDQLSATQLIIEIRKNHHKTGKWPTTISAPVSSLTGKSLDIDLKSRQIRLTASDGKPSCDEVKTEGYLQLCIFPFEASFAPSSKVSK